MASDPLKAFTDFAGRAARNPLGIIALFIVLVDAIAALTLSRGSSDLTEIQRWPLVLFVTIFPLVVLCVFYCLVAWHHTKLYAPSDFHDDSGFLHAMSLGEQGRRLIAELEDEGEPPRPQLSPAEQAAEPMINEIAALEDLALRAIEADVQLPVRRNVVVADHAVDAVFITGRKLIAVEVKVLRSSSSALRVLQRAIEHAADVSRSDRFSRLILAFVTTGIAGDELLGLESQARRRVADTGASVEIRFLDAIELRERFGVGAVLRSRNRLRESPEGT